MLAVVGTIPIEGFPLVAEYARTTADGLEIEGHTVPINRGTPALIAAAIETARVLNLHDPFCYLVGDIGRGAGSRQLYEYLSRDISKHNFKTVTFHYVQPDIQWQNCVLSLIEKGQEGPILIADAGFMYGAKMAGRSEEFALFTPDLGELAFLADEEAPHPFYTRGFILHEENHVPDLISRAYEHHNAAHYLLVKGCQDYVADRQGVLSVIGWPIDEAMEAIGGTGDTLTGIVAALSASGMDIRRAAVVAARTNRLAGSYAHPTPATQVMEIIRYIPEALKVCMAENQ